MAKVPQNMIKTMLEDYFSTRTVKCALTYGFTESSDVTTFEAGQPIYDAEIAAGNGYVAGGVTVTPTVAVDDAADTCTVTISTPQWDASGGPVGPYDGCVVYVEETGLIMYNDNVPESTHADGVRFSLTFPASELFTIAQAG